MKNERLENLIQELIRTGYLKTTNIIDAFRKIDRADFVPFGLQEEAYGNYPLAIGFGQTISQPLTVAFMLELLQPQPGEKILDIGSGSGWQTCLLAYIASRSLINADKKLIDADSKSALIGKNRHKSALVIAIERIPELKAMTEENVRKYNFIEKGIVEAVYADGTKGYPSEAPFDRIIAAASLPAGRPALDEIPRVWREQLKINGRIVAPIGHSVWKLDKISDKEFKTEEYFGFSFVPLIRNEKREIRD